VHAVRQAFAADLDGCHAVEAQQRQVGEIFLAQGFSPEMGVYVSNPGKPPSRRSRPLALRQQDLFRIPDDHLLDIAPSVDEDTDLPPDFP